MKVSTLILTYNEGANLPACLDALHWCDDVVVLDSGSSDETVPIAAARGARVLHRAFDDFASQRNYGLDRAQLRHEWVLHLDADEIVSDGFRAALEALEPARGIDAYRVPFKTIFFGKWLRQAALWPGYQVRLGHVKRLRFRQVGHGQREDLPPERVGSFPCALLHYSFSHGMQRWLLKHVRYAQDEARAIVADRREGESALSLMSGDWTGRHRAMKRLAARMPVFLRPLARFLYMFVWRRGFLDGARGFVYAFMLATFEAMIAIFVYEVRRGADANRIPSPSGGETPRPRAGAR